MPQTVTLSTGETVTFKDKYTHSMDMLYWKVREEGKDSPAQRHANKAALDAVLLLAITGITKDGGGPYPATPSWIDDLSIDDYTAVANPLIDLMNAAAKKVEAGKKN